MMDKEVVVDGRVESSGSALTKPVGIKGAGAKATGPNVKVDMDRVSRNVPDSSISTIGGQEAKATIRLPVNDRWGVEGGGQIRFRTSHTLRILAGIVLLFFTGGVILSWRIRVLEAKNDDLQNQLADIRLIMEKMVKYQENMYSIEYDNDDDSSIKVPTYGYGDNNNDDALKPKVPTLFPGHGDLQKSAGRIRRTRRSLEMTEKNPNNDTSRDESIWSRVPNLKTNGRKKDRGKIRQYEMLRQRDQGVIAKLKLKLKSARTRAKTTKNLYNRASLLGGVRAAYLIINGPNVNIQKPEQLIGPWYLAENGSEYGFDDFWYDNLRLDANGTSVIFQESGLYLIYAQVYYHIVVGRKDKPSPMGFRIYLRKNSSVHRKVFQRPFPLAECVPSYPSTAFQTCFTQAAWGIGAGDEIYLEHFAPSLPTIEAEKQGQTYLGIVKY